MDCHRGQLATVTLLAANLRPAWLSHSPVVLECRKNLSEALQKSLRGSDEAPVLDEKGQISRTAAALGSLEPWNRLGKLWVRPRPMPEGETFGNRILPL